MKGIMTGLLRGRTTRYSLIAAVLAAAGLSLAWMGQPHYQLGGGWIGSGGGMIWTCFQMPLDPAGRTAAVRVNPVAYGADIAGLLAMFGADSSENECTGEAEMTSRDTAKWAFVEYGRKGGNPPQICMILVYTGTLKYGGPDRFDVEYTLDVYPGPANILGLPNADADGDGFPDPDVAPVMSFPGGGTAKRVPVP
jgi:hypothetical protein